MKRKENPMRIGEKEAKVHVRRREIIVLGMIDEMVVATGEADMMIGTGGTGADMMTVIGIEATEAREMTTGGDSDSWEGWQTWRRGMSRRHIEEGSHDPYLN